MFRRAAGQAGKTSLVDVRGPQVEDVEMKKVVMFRARGMLTLCCLVGGCAALAPLDGSFGSLLGGGPPPADVQQQTSLRLSQSNFLLVRTNEIGTSKGFSLLGLITMVPATAKPPD